MASKFRVPFAWEEQPPPRDETPGEPYAHIREMLAREYPDPDPTEEPVSRIRVGSPIGDLRRGRDGLIRRLREHTGMSYSEARAKGEQAIRDIERSRKG